MATFRGPLPFADIILYGRLEGLCGEALDRLRTLLQAMDAVYMEHSFAELSRSTKKGKDQ